MPAIPDITTSVNNQKHLVLDSHVKTGVFRRDTKGSLVRYAGGFTVVYPYNTSNGEKWAFRCWHSELGNVRTRFETISKAIQSSKLPYLCDFIYVDKGISVDGKIYPTTRMRWVEGQTLKTYVCKNSHSQKTLLDLANKFLLLAKDMHNHSLAHGDLQHGNIIVGNDGKLYLVDYDSFYCPQLKGEKDIITGLKDYQHPSRKNNSYISEKIDYFSELIIYTSILGIAYKSNLAEKYNVEDSEHMLFEAKDFENIVSSTIYQDLKGLDPIFPVLLNILEEYLSKQSIDELEPFDVILERLTKKPVISSFNIRPSSNLYVGDKAKLFWAVSDAKQVFLDGKVVGTFWCERELRLPGKTSFVLKAKGHVTEVSNSLDVTVYEIPKISLSASKSVLRKGEDEKTTITWNVKNASKVTLCYNGVTEEIPDNGSAEFAPEETTTYILKVVGLDKTRIFEEKKTILVCPQAVVSFTSDKDEMLAKRKVKVSWAVENADKVELLEVGVVSAEGEYDFSVEQDMTCKLKVTDVFGVREHALPIKVLPLPVIKFVADKKKLNRDKAEKTKVSWDVKNAWNVSLEYLGTTESVKKKDSRDFSLDDTTEFRLKCLALDKTTVFEKKLNIRVLNEARISFSSDKKYTISNVPVRLSWNVVNSKNVELKGYGKVAPQGSKDVIIEKDDSFSLVVTDEFSTQEKSVDIKVLPLPQVKSVSVPVPEINKSLNVSINIPRINTNIHFPQFNLPNIDIEVPHPPSMNDMFESISSNIKPGLFSEIKSLFSHYFNR